MDETIYFTNVLHYFWYNVYNQFKYNFYILSEVGKVYMFFFRQKRLLFFFYKATANSVTQRFNNIIIYFHQTFDIVGNQIVKCTMFLF